MTSMITRTMAGALGGLVGETVCIKGWVARLRVLGGLTFVLVRERTGMVQVVLEKGVYTGPALTPEAVIAVSGRVVASARAPGGVEIHATHLELLNPTFGQLPVEVSGTELGCGIELMVEQRVLTLRHPRQAAIFRVQAAIAEAFATFLRAEGFLEFFSPKLIASGTEGGSELFEVGYFGRKAFLAQSPQLYKEMMVASGAERVFEIGHVYRAEPHETARHLNEYVSLDVEMAFITGEAELMAIETRLLQHIFAHLHATCAAELALWGATAAVPATIPAVTLEEALALLESLGLPVSERGDLSPAGERLLCEHAARHWGSEFVFVTAFPKSSRPFYTMTQAEAPHLTKSFDLLYRGLEITSGGQRLHALGELEGRMAERGMALAAFGPYLEAFKHGMPPHGGFAIGLERLTARVLGLSNVREASLFPRTRHHLAP